MRFAFNKSTSVKMVSILYQKSLGKTFFSWGGGRALEGRLISENEHQKGRVIPLCELFKGRVTSLLQFFNEDFCDVAFHFSYRLKFPFYLL